MCIYRNVFIYICIAFMHGTSAFREIRVVLMGYIYDNISDSISKPDKRFKRDLCNLKVKKKGGTFIFAPVPNFFAFMSVSLKRKRTMRLVKTTVNVVQFSFSFFVRV